MQLAFCLFKYFAFGGIPRDFRNIANAALARGHRVRVYTLRWEGDPEPNFDVVIVPVKAVTNHTLYKRYNRWLLQHLRTHPVDLVVGMNKMAGLDAYYAGDSCYEEKARTQRSWLYRLTPRYRFFRDAERAVFRSSGSAEVMMISNVQKPFFKIHYGTPEHRFHDLPPGIDRDRVAPEDTSEVRHRLRKEFGIADNEHMLLFVGSGFIKKGLDRLLLAVKHLPKPFRNTVHLIVAGQDNEDPFLRMARRLGIEDRVKFLGGRDDVPALLFAADAMALPAYDENAGIVIIESLVAGLPVLVTNNCGYAVFVERANGGIVHQNPFDLEQFTVDLETLLTSDERDAWRANGRALAKDESIYQMEETAVKFLEQFAEQRRPRVVFAWDSKKPLVPVELLKKCVDSGYDVRLLSSRHVHHSVPGVLTERLWVSGITQGKRALHFRDAVGDYLATTQVDCLIGPANFPGIDIAATMDTTLATIQTALRARHNDA